MLGLRGEDKGKTGQDGVEQEAEAGTQESGAELGTEVTEAELWKGELGDPMGGAGRSLPPTPDAQPALSAPTYPRERPAGYIPTPCTTPTPVSPERFHNHAQVYEDTRTYVHTRPNNDADARWPHSGRAVPLV